jgi:hypothetical protein
MANTAAVKGVAYPLQPAGSLSLGNGNAIQIPSSFNRHQVLIKTSAGVASGAVSIETADVADYTGAWDLVTTAITVPAASTVDVYNFTGIYRAIRARISTVVAGGTITVEYIGAP